MRLLPGRARRGARSASIRPLRHGWFARSGKFRCRIIRIGDLYRVATDDLIRLLGFTADGHQAPPNAA
jgi:hypothetical protein